MLRKIVLPLCLLLAGLGLAACSGSGEGGREIVFTQTDDGCTPESVDVTPGEKLKLTGKNESGQTFELEGTNGTDLEEILIPEGKTRSVGYTVPDEAGTHDVKCYQPGGASTIVKLVAGGGSSSEEEGAEDEEPIVVGGNDDPADETVDVELTDYVITPSSASATAGNVEFAAMNASDGEVHELAILEVADDGGKEVVGEIEDIPSGVASTIRLNLEPGVYELACLIVAGEAGSDVDHYEQGMHTEFSVE